MPNADYLHHALLGPLTTLEEYMDRGYHFCRRGVYMAALWDCDAECLLTEESYRFNGPAPALLGTCMPRGVSNLCVRGQSAVTGNGYDLMWLHFHQTEERLEKALRDTEERIRQAAEAQKDRVGEDISQQ